MSIDQAHEVRERLEVYRGHDARRVRAAGPASRIGVASRRPAPFASGSVWQRHREQMDLPFRPPFNELFGVTLWPGSLNLWASEPIAWDDPFGLSAAGVAGEFCPVVLEEVAVGVAFRAPPYTPEYLEVLSPVELRPRLGGLQDGQMVGVRLLSGDLLRTAA